VIRAQDRKVVDEKALWPPKLGEDKDDTLADDEEPAENCKKYTGGLERNSRSLEIVALDVKLIAGCVSECSGGDFVAAANGLYITRVANSLD
jgi:hypothetical protein